MLRNLLPKAKTGPFAIIGASGRLPCRLSSSLPYGRAAEILQKEPRYLTSSEINKHNQEIQSFDDLNLSSEVQVAISQSGIVVPTSSQISGIPKMLNGENLLLISQTGKGKTLAYLIPVVDKLIRTDTERMYPQPQKPRAIIVVPTRELVIQTMKVIRKVFGSFISSIGLAPNYLSFVKEQRILGSSGADLVVTTPSRFELHLKKGPTKGGICLSAVQSFVFDEADTLCDSVYEQGIRQLITKLTGRKNYGCQIAIVGATRTAAVNAFVSSIPGLEISPVLTSDAHTLVPQLEQVFVPVGRRKRTNCLSEILMADKATDNFKTLIFTNSVKTCNFVSKFLRESQICDSTSLHGEMAPKIRAANFRKFTDPGCNVLVCTNLASRGIDLDNITHVIMYDFPHTLADYIHRAGRTGRAGRLGKVTALFTKRNLVLARQIEQAAKLGKPIEYVKPKSEQSSRKAVKLEKYRSALDQLKNAPRQKLRVLKATLGLPPHSGIGGVEKRAVAKNWRADKTKEKELEFLKRRKRVDKKTERLSDLPNPLISASETRTSSQIIRDKISGNLQYITKNR